MQRVVHLCPVHCPPVVELCRQRPIAVALENESKIDITTRCHWPTVGFEGSFGAFDAHWTRQGRFQDPSDYCFFLLIEMLLISAISSGLAWPTGLPFNGPSSDPFSSCLKDSGISTCTYIYKFKHMYIWSILIQQH